MLVVLLCCMMKLVELSTGKPVVKDPYPGKKRRKYIRRKGKIMNEVGSLGVRGLVSPDSDCNSNHHGSTSYLSNTSSQDIDFIQDNSDYQWFLDYGYRDGGVNHHTSILSLPETYASNEINYYDAFSKNMDANLAEADMESFKTEDIHALLTNLPPMCTDHLSQEGTREGECYASVSGSMMAKFDFDSSISPHSSSQGEDSANSASMSIYKSELLFSPVKETPMPGTNYSVDSLDCDMMLTCQANKDNYTIAFEGSVMYSEDSDYHDADKAAHWSADLGKQKMNAKLTDANMTQSDSSSFTTWSKLKKRSSDNHLRRHPSGNNNNNSTDERSHFGLHENSSKSHSMPNLYKEKLRHLLASTYIANNSNTSSDTCTVMRKPVKVFDIQHHIQSSSSGASGASLSDMATSVDASGGSEPASTRHQSSFSLVKLFMKQKSMSTEGMSTTMDPQSSSDNWPASQSGESSASEPKTGQNPTEIDISTARTYDLIAEEPEDEISRSESVTESLSKLDSITGSVETTKRPNLNINNRYSREKALKHNLTSRSMQTSQFSEVSNLKNTTKVTKKQPQLSYKIIEPSFLAKLKQEGEEKKPVYVLYPNYVLPNLDFLNEKAHDVLLVPQEAPNVRALIKKRPFSCNDVEQLKRKGFKHVKDWDSLNFLLPQEYRTLLADCVKPKEKSTLAKQRPLSSDYASLAHSSGSSTATQPSSGYRGSSTLLSDSSQANPLFVYRYDSVTSSEASCAPEKPIVTSPALPMRYVRSEQTPPRPPLPRGILRNQKKHEKRYSLYETSDEELVEEVAHKRKSLQDPYFARTKRFSETEDEGVDAGTSSSSVDDYSRDFLLANISNDELLQLGEFLKISGMSGASDDEPNEASLMQLRSYVGKFLALKMNQDNADLCAKKVTFNNHVPKGSVEPKAFNAPNNSPNVSALMQQKPKTLLDTPISEENENASQNSPIHRQSSVMGEKRALIISVSDAVAPLIRLSSSQAILDDSACARMALTSLCPALYAILSDGLKPSLETSFGAINNSVWQVVEASAQQGPLTRALNELVMRINGEDAISEGLVKFNAFVFGLLNVRSLDAWLSYLRTRESILKKHYTSDSLLIMSHTNSGLLDGLIAALQPLALLPFQLDLLFEYRQLHLSFKRMDSYKQSSKLQMSPVHKPGKPGIDDLEPGTMPDILTSSAAIKIRERPRSCIESGGNRNFRLGDVTKTTKKRWSGISPNSKLHLVYDRLAKEEEEEYTDSLEHGERVAEEKSDSSEMVAPSLQEDGPESLDSNISDEKPINGRRFRKLQQKWEMLSGRESNDSPPVSPTNKSRIPRPIMSPIWPSGIPVLVSPTAKAGVKLLKKVITPPGTAPLGVLGKVGACKVHEAKKPISAPRTSRVDQLEHADKAKHVARPSSLPYKGVNAQKVPKVTPPRRAVSSSLSRKTIGTKSTIPKVVRTLSSRLPSESGHLSFNEGERLKVVLEVDDKWLLCCRGTQKGLVPKSAVIADFGRLGYI